MNLSFFQKAEALLRSSCKNKHANNSHILVQKSQILLEIVAKVAYSWTYYNIVNLISSHLNF